MRKEDFGAGARLGRAGALFCACCVVGAALGTAALVHFDADTEATGELYRAAAFVENFAKDNEAIAVFLGIGAEEEEDAITVKAQEYIEKHNAGGTV